MTARIAWRIVIYTTALVSALTALAATGTSAHAEASRRAPQMEKARPLAPATASFTWQLDGVRADADSAVIATNYDFRRTTTPMGYETGTIGPITYTQDNSGDATDTDTHVVYTPDMFGAPPGAQVIAGTVQIVQHVSRGLAYVHDVDRFPVVSFWVYTQAAGGGIFGHHSGAITVTTTFQWYYITNNALKGGDRFFTREAPSALPNQAA